MRWMLCCVWLAGCSLDTKPAPANMRDAENASARQWTPRDTAADAASTSGSAEEVSASMQQAEGSAAKPSRTDAGESSVSATKTKARDAGKGESTDAGMPASMSGAASMPSMPSMPATPTMPTMPATPVTTTSDAGIDASVPASQPMDAGGAVEHVDAATPDASEGASNLLVWFALTGTNQQRRALYPLIADLEGTRMIDSEGMLSVLRNFDELQCRRNAAVCYQVCIWATSHCDVCEGWECRRLMLQSCGSDCRTDEEPANP